MTDEKPMTAEKLLERLKKFYMSTFDLEESHSVVRNSDAESAEREEREFALYGHFNVDNSRYVLSKKAKLWEANCQEHLFVDVPGEGGRLDGRRLQDIDELLRQTVEPYYVRHGEKYPPANHMYSYITVVIVTDGPIEPEIKKLVKSYRFSKTYRFNLRGYMETRMVLISITDKTVITNQAGKPLTKAYRRLIM